MRLSQDRYVELHNQIFRMNREYSLSHMIMDKPKDSCTEEVLEVADRIQGVYAGFVVDKLRVEAVKWYAESGVAERVNRIQACLFNNLGLKPPSAWLNHLKPYDVVWMHRALSEHGAYDLSRRIREGYDSLNLPTMSLDMDNT